jgi:hypothetical protein
MSFHPVSGMLYACTYDGVIYTIDPLSGVPSYIGTTDNSLPDIQFDAEGILYGVAGGGSQTGELIVIVHIGKRSGLLF